MSADQNADVIRRVLVEQGWPVVVPALDALVARITELEALRDENDEAASWWQRRAKDAEAEVARLAVERDEWKTRALAAEKAIGGWHDRSETATAEIARLDRQLGSERQHSAYLATDNRTLREALAEILTVGARPSDPEFLGTCRIHEIARAALAHEAAPRDAGAEGAAE